MRQKDRCNLAGAFSLVAKLAVELQTRESVGVNKQRQTRQATVTGGSGELGAAYRSGRVREMTS